MPHSNQFSKMSFHNCVWLLVFLVLIACGEKSSQLIEDPSLSAGDIDQIREISRNYTQGWIENDSEKVLRQYTDSATIIPSGLSPLDGINAITDFWFPNDSSKTAITDYKI